MLRLLSRTIVWFSREHFVDAADVRGLLALLLADGSLVLYPSPCGGYVQLTLTAGLLEAPYLEEKVAEFRQFIPTKAQIIPYKSAERANGRRSDVLRFRVSTTKLRPVYNMLYPGHVRRITRNVLEVCGARAAAWLWAEGVRHLSKNRIELARVGATEAEAHLIGGWLQVLSGATCTMATTIHKRPRLLFTPEQTEKITQALLPYAPKSRAHLFAVEPQLPNVSTIRSARTELLLGEGAPLLEGPSQDTVA